MAHIVAISSGPIMRPQDGRPFVRGEVVAVDSNWTVMLPDFPEAFVPQADVVSLIEREMAFHPHCTESSLKRMDQVVVEIRFDSEAEIILPLTEVLIQEKATWILSGEAGRGVVDKLMEHGHRRSTILYDTEASRERRRTMGMPADAYFMVERLMEGLPQKLPSLADLSSESRR